MTVARQTFFDILDLEHVDDNRFRGRSHRTSWRRVFGGQVLAQAVIAAARSVSGRSINSLHAYFVLPGDPELPIDYVVEPIRDGYSFSVRRITAIQEDRPIFTASASFHRGETGYEHQPAMPDVPSPEDLPDGEELMRTVLADAPESIRRYWRRDRPVDLRPTDAQAFATGKREATRSLWMRCLGPFPDGDHVHQAAIAYASDLTLIDSTLMVHGTTVLSPQIQAASLDHAIWFHRPARADAWLLYTEEGPVAAGARGFALGRFFTRDGELVASTAQEGLIRPRDGSDANA